MELRKFIATTIREYLNESSSNEIKILKKQLKQLDNWFGDFAGTNIGYKLWDEKVEEANIIRKKLYQLTGDPYGETKSDKQKKECKTNWIK